MEKIKLGLKVAKSPTKKDEFTIFINDVKYTNDCYCKSVVSKFIKDKGFDVDIVSFCVNFKVEDFFIKKGINEVKIWLKNGNCIKFDVRFEGVKSDEINDYFNYLVEKLEFIVNKLQEEWDKQPFVNAYIEKYV